MAGGYYGGGYKSNPAIDNVALPDKIKCCRCRKIKGPNSYSKKRQDDLKARILNDRRFNATVSEHIPCTMCTGGQVVELHCCMCDKTKGLDKFSKAQRRNPDKAKCWSCMQDIANTEPGMEDNDESGGSSGSDGGSDSDSDSDAGGSTLAGTMTGMSLNSGSFGNSSFPSSATGGVKLNASGGGVSSYTSSTGGYVNASTASRASSSTAGGASVMPNLPHLRNKGPASVADSDTASTTSRASTTTTGGLNASAWSTPAPRRGNAPSITAPSRENTDNRKFAKVKVVPRPVIFDVAQQEKESKGGVQVEREAAGQGKAKSTSKVEEPDDEVTVESSDDSD